MKRIYLTCTLALLTSACGHTLMQPPVADQSHHGSATKTQTGKSERVQFVLPTDEKGAPTGAQKWQEPGDFVVYQFTGSFRSDPLRLTQRVIERQDDALILDVIIEDADQHEHLRLRLKMGTEGDEILSVARIENGVQRPFGRAAYEALMARTALTVDANDGLLNTETVTLDMGRASIPCTRSAFQVRVGERQATMMTLASTDFPWGDLAGEIIAADGTLLYRAQIVEIGSPTTTHEVIAIQADPDDYEEYDEDWDDYE